MSYDPTVGRWTAEDPIAFEGGDTNLYRYVGNSPVNAVDPSGLEGFWQSIGDSWRSIGDGMLKTGVSAYESVVGDASSILVTPTWEDIYNRGPLGQTQDDDGIYYYGTRGAIAVATVATSFACVAGVAELAGAPQFTAIVGPGRPFHVVYQVGNGSRWLHATGMNLGRLRVTSASADQTLKMAEGQIIRFTGPVILRGAASATGQRALTCATGAIHAYIRGWIPFLP